MGIYVMNELIVKTPAFEHEGLIPKQYTGYGADISPEIHLSNIDDRAKSIAIIMDDMGHPIPAYNHWVIWNIPVIQVIPGNIPHGKTVDVLSEAIQGRGYGKHRYRGPKPPFNWSHKYQFNVFILDCTLNLPVASRKRDLINAMDGHIIQQAILVGHYR
jgi:Raf kinase inhibitor-like YbhB/YbcL family protein